jgi:hypothetical protein
VSGYRVELADVAPAEAAQEGAQRGRGLDDEPENLLRAAGAQGGRVVDAVTARERGEDQGQELVADVRPARRLAEVEVLPHELLQAEMLGQGGRQQEPGIGHELRPVERRVDPVEAVGRSHPAGAPLRWADGWFATPSFPIRRAPVLLSRIVNHAGGSVDPG